MTQKPTKSGLKGFGERLADFEKLLNDYEVDTGTVYLNYNDGVDDILALKRQDLQILTYKEALVYSYEIERYSIYIQKQMSRQKTRYEYAEHYLGRIVATEYEKYKGNDEYVKYDLIYNRIINKNTAAEVLSSIMLHAKSRINELDHLARKVGSLASILKEIGSSEWRK